MDSTFKLYNTEGNIFIPSFPEELLPVVNQHWADFGPQDSLIIHVWGIAFFLLTFVNFFGNFLVIYVYLYVKELRTPVSLI